MYNLSPNIDQDDVKYRAKKSSVVMLRNLKLDKIERINDEEFLDDTDVQYYWEWSINVSIEGMAPAEVSMCWLVGQIDWSTKEYDLRVFKITDDKYRCLWWYDFKHQWWYKNWVWISKIKYKNVCKEVLSKTEKAMRSDGVVGKRFSVR